VHLPAADEAAARRERDQRRPQEVARRSCCPWPLAMSAKCCCASPRTNGSWATTGQRASISRAARSSPGSSAWSTALRGSRTARARTPRARTRRTAGERHLSPATGLAKRGGECRSASDVHDHREPVLRQVGDRLQLRPGFREAFPGASTRRREGRVRSPAARRAATRLPRHHVARLPRRRFHDMTSSAAPASSAGVGIENSSTRRAHPRRGPPPRPGSRPRGRRATAWGSSRSRAGHRAGREVAARCGRADRPPEEPAEDRVLVARLLRREPPVQVHEGRGAPAVCPGGVTGRSRRDGVSVHVAPPAGKHC